MYGWPLLGIWSGQHKFKIQAIDALISYSLFILIYNNVRTYNAVFSRYQPSISKLISLCVARSVSKVCEAIAKYRGNNNTSPRNGSCGMFARTSPSTANIDMAWSIGKQKKKTIYLLLCTIDKSSPITGTFFFSLYTMLLGKCSHFGWRNDGSVLARTCEATQHVNHQFWARVCFSCGCCCGSRDDRTARDWVWSRRIDKLFQLTGACNWLCGGYWIGPTPRWELFARECIHEDYRWCLPIYDAMESRKSCCFYNFQLVERK